jgi:hypothetical protein
MIIAWPKGMLMCFTIVATFKDGSGGCTHCWGKSSTDAVRRFKARFNTQGKDYVQTIHQVIRSERTEVELLSTSDIRSKIDSLVALVQEVGHPNASKVWDAGVKAKQCLNDLDDAISRGDLY